MGMTDPRINEESRYPTALCHAILHDVYNHLSQRRRQLDAMQPQPKRPQIGKVRPTTQAGPRQPVVTHSDECSDLGLTRASAGSQTTGRVVGQVGKMQPASLRGLCLPSEIVKSGDMHEQPSQPCVDIVHVARDVAGHSAPPRDDVVHDVVSDALNE